ncbi:MAG: hypothetical protein Q7I99_05900 [Acholeplasmataceae bacterium]|nr:hypothetical protein [Acholeplasmataceae bacterium]
MSSQYLLSPGSYFIGDPAILIKKTPEGDRFISTLWDLFYRDMNLFQKLTIDNITVYITRTAEGDGMFNDIGTDTGTISIIKLNDIKNDSRFRANDILKGCHYLEITSEEKVTVTDFNMYFDNGYQVITNFI